MKDKFFCDSNILLYAFGNQDFKKKKIASKILLDEKCIISVQVINEVSNIMIKKLNFSNSQIEQFIHACYQRYLIVALDETLFTTACNIRENYNISYYDSLIVSSAINASCSILYSEDMHHNLKIDLLTIINPFKE